VAILKDPTVPAFVRPLVRPRPGITIGGQRSIITQVVVSQATNHQFLHTLGNDIFVYVFGDRIGEMTITGLSFSRLCTPFGCNPGFLGGAQHGMELMLEYYRRNKMSSRQSPIVVQLGRIPIKGFITGMTQQMNDPATWIVQYGLRVAILPDQPSPNELVTSPFDQLFEGLGGLT
jgi:hypothetical protein